MEGRIPEAERTEERERDPGAADEQVFPRGLERTRRVVEVQKGHRRERHRLGRDPQNPEMPRLVAGAQQAQNREQRRHKNPIGTLLTDPQIRDRIDAADKK